MNAMIIFLVVCAAVLVIERVRIKAASVNYLIDAVGDFWSNLLYLAVIFGISIKGDLFDGICGFLGIAVGIILSMLVSVIAVRIKRPTPLVFFASLEPTSFGEDTQ